MAISVLLVDLRGISFNNFPMHNILKSVVLMKKSDVLKAISVQPEILMTILNLGPGFNHAGLKDLGCKFPKNGALVKMGEGDGNANIIYTLKADTSAFAKFSECNNVESVD